MEILRSIGRKSINAFFSAEEIKKAQKWAYKFYQELNVKSPFFRAWFGEWRAHEKSITNIITVDTTAIVQSGNAINRDTKRKLSWDKEVAKESRLNAPQEYKNDMFSIGANLSQIVENSILFDSVVSDKSSKRKLEGTSWMHSFYSVVNTDGRLSLIKLFAEEAFSEKQNISFTRAYTLKFIEKVAEFDNGVLSRLGGLTGSPSTTTISISDLYELVKTFDKEFTPAPEVDKVLLNEDGTPKKFYHGTDAKFTEFKAEEMSHKEGSYFFAENREDAEAYGKNIHEVYLTGRKLADYDNQPSEFYKLRDKRKQVEWLKEREYDGWYADMDSGGWGELSVFSPEQIKSAKGNIGTFSRYETDTKYSRKTVDPITSREELAKALSKVAKGEDRAVVETYKANVNLIKDETARLESLRKEIDEIKYKNSITYEGRELSVKGV